jgi:hypothetical protein
MLWRSAMILGIMGGFLPGAGSRLGTVRAKQVAPPTQLGSARLGPTESAGVLEAYGRLPLSFEKNQGQANARVRYLSRGRGYSLFLTPSAAVLFCEGEPTARGTRSGGERPGTA